MQTSKTEQPKVGVNTIPRLDRLGLKLRRQALSRGLAPGSPRWRAYVLGTLAAARRREKEKRRRKPS